MNPFLHAGLSTRDCEGFQPIADKDWAYDTFDDERVQADRRADRDGFVYRSNAATMRDLMDLGDAFSAEFMECWVELETIKARWGGMPPR